MGIFRQILQALLLILAELRLIRQDTLDLDKGIEELVQLEQSTPEPTALEINFQTPKHK